MTIIMIVLITILSRVLSSIFEVDNRIYYTLLLSSYIILVVLHSVQFSIFCFIALRVYSLVHTHLLYSYIHITFIYINVKYCHIWGEHTSHYYHYYCYCHTNYIIWEAQSKNGMIYIKIYENHAILPRSVSYINL